MNDETSVAVPDGRRGTHRRAVRWIAALTTAAGVIGLVTVLWPSDRPSGDPGATSEELFVIDGTAVTLVDVTSRWGLNTWTNGSRSPLAGGVAIGDVDRDGRNDLVVGGGDVVVFIQTDDGFVPLRGAFNEIDGVSSVGLADLDRDGWLDLMVGATIGDAAVVWGSEWWASGTLDVSTVTWVSGGEPTTGMLAGDLYGNGLLDIVRLGYGVDVPVADVVFRQIEGRRFEAVELLHPERKSMAAEIADFDGDGVIDIWITRATGWEGADSVWSRGAGGDWVDIAPTIGAASEIDGAGVTVADLNGDGILDTYLSDVGDNELLAGSATGFSALPVTGAGRIRPLNASGSVVSASWASGVADLNGDAIADLVVANGGFPDGSGANKVPDTTVLVDDPPAVFIGLGGGRYADVWPQLGLEWTGAARGMAIGDLDADGDADIVMVRTDGGIAAYRNDTDTGASRRLVRVVADPMCDPAGAVMSLTTVEGRVQRLAGAHSFAGSHARELTVGSPGEAVVVVKWADGTRFEAQIAPDDPLVVTATCG